MHWQDRVAQDMPMYQRERQYRIQWKSLLTEYTGHGDWFSMDKKQMLEINVKEINETYKDEIHHWLVEGV
jgi:hypothetical protein